MTHIVFKIKAEINLRIRINQDYFQIFSDQHHDLQFLHAAQHGSRSGGFRLPEHSGPDVPDSGWRKRSLLGGLGLEVLPLHLHGLQDGSANRHGQDGQSSVVQNQCYHQVQNC